MGRLPPEALLLIILVVVAGTIIVILLQFLLFLKQRKKLSEIENSEINRFSGKHTLFHQIITFFGSKFTHTKDPLDELLIEKGLDPDKVLENAADNRYEKGDSDPVNRMFDRIDQNKRRVEKMRDNFRGFQ